MNEQTTISKTDFSDIGKAIAAGIESARPKKVTAGQYAAREAKANPKPKLKWESGVFQNGYRCEELTAKEMEALNRITHSGRYFERKLEVIVRNEGNEKALELRYPNKTIDHRFEMGKHYRSFLEMVSQIADLQEAEDLELETAPKARR